MNHRYGMFLVESRRLFDAVNTFDFGVKASRALILTEVLEDN